MHIVFITPGFAQNDSDTTTIPPLLLYARQLVENGIKVSVISIDYPLQQRNYQIGNINVYAMGGANKGWPYKLFTLLKAGRLFGKLHKQQPVDVIHSFWWQDTAVLGSWLSKHYNIPHLTTCMGQDVLPSNRYAQWFSAKNEYVVALSAFHAASFNQTFGRPCNDVIPFGVTPAEFATENNCNRDIDILGVGSLTDVKNYDEFIDTVAIVKQQYPTFNCVIAGDGKNRKALEQKARALGVESNITFAGLLPRAEVLQLMARSRVLLHTSRFESLGYVFLEAMMCGAVIVSHRVGVADDTNALIGDTPVQLAANIVAVLNDEVNLNIPPVYTMQQTAGRYIELYKIYKGYYDSAYL